jgi:fatty acid omega-hydroxylase
MPWSQSERLLRKYLQDIDTFVYSIIKQRKNEKFSTERSDLLSRYLSLTDEDGNAFTEKFLRDMMLNVIIAARDTTGVMLTVIFYLLATHPEQERKLVEEIEKKIGMETPTFENVKDMEYLKGVQNEALR